MSRPPAVLSALVCLVLAAGACTDDSTTDEAAGAASGPSSTESRPDGPMADLSEEISGGGGVFVGSPSGVRVDGTYDYDFDEPDYVEEEFVAAGTAKAYVAEDELTSDGEWTLAEGEDADYRTRVIVRRPENPDDFSGVVVVEWFNVSGGVDADPEWTSVSEEVLREGHAWVGVSAQEIGIEGGAVRVEVDVPGSEAAGVGLKGYDPERYGDLEHPGDAFSYDIFSQIARSLRDGAGLGDLEPSVLVAVGESQSAGALVTYYNGFQPMTDAFDGFFVHSRGAAGLPIPPPGESVDITSTLGRTPTIFRTDVDAPVVNLQAEGDLTSFLGSAEARQEDSETFRLWELAGSPHADVHLVGESTLELSGCGTNLNDGPMHIISKAGLRGLVDWIQKGDAPPEAPRLEVTDGEEAAIARDDDGIAIGGLRPPPVDVPVKVYSGERGEGGEAICAMVGSATALSPERLAELYPSPGDYESLYSAAVEEAIETGFVLDADREAIEAYMDPSVIPG